jgi:hypothetical protein
VPPGPALPLVAAPALPRRIQFLGATGAEQSPLPEKRTGLQPAAALQEGGRSQRPGDGGGTHIRILTYDN